MIEKLKDSVESLSAPLCAACRTEMTWYRSELAGAEDAIVHHFFCSSCSGTSTLKTRVGHSGQTAPLPKTGGHALPHAA